MPKDRQCERCGVDLSDNVPDGLCPACMLKVGLDSPVSPPQPTIRLEVGAPELEQETPRFIGGYQILEEIGHGGMGVVYLAEQKEPVRRRVALKITKLGMDTKDVIARFDVERQALALMDHSNIAKVLDAGATENGRPYFVMELVRGLKITDYCDQHKLSTAERLNLFMQVCRAVQHAHQKGVIHRDLKPSNILVSVQDGVPVPKVIDFGVAKATGPSLTEKTVFTAFQQMIGTPAYMSPEQAEMGRLDIDTRSDIYSLGVLLYELLTGRTPFDTEDLLRAGLDAMRRKIRDEEPPRPSTRLTSLTNEELTTVARHRKVEPPRLIHLVRGDLDWIVMKALDKERSRRYETANGLAMDIQRHLGNEAIVARPARNVYRVQKFVRRNKVVVAAAATVACALVGALVMSSWQTARAVRARNEALSNSRVAQQLTTFLTNMFEWIDPELAKLREITVREVLDVAASTINTNFSNEPATELLMRRTLADIYIKLGRDDQALPHEEAGLRLAKRAASEKDDANVATALNDVAGSLDALGRSAEALPIYQEALAMYLRIRIGDHADVVDSLNYVARCLDALGRSAEALPKMEAALAMSQRLHKGDHDQVAESLNNLGSILSSLDRTAEALPKYQAALEMRQRLYKGDHPNTVTSLNNVASCLGALGRGAEAVQFYEMGLAMSQRIYKGDHPYLAVSLNNIGAGLQDLGRDEEALLKFEAALAMRRRLFRGDHPYVATSLNNVALCLQALGRSQEALPKFQEAVAMYQAIYTGDNLRLATTLNNLGLCLKHLDRISEALPKFEAALTMAERLEKNDNADVATFMENYGDCLNGLGRAGDALTNYESAIAILERLLVKQPGNGLVELGLGRMRDEMGDLLKSSGKSRDAAESYRKGLQITETLLTSDPANVKAKKLRLDLQTKLGQEPRH